MCGWSCNIFVLYKKYSEIFFARGHLGWRMVHLCCQSVEVLCRKLTAETIYLCMSTDLFLQLEKYMWCGTSGIKRNMPGISSYSTTFSRGKCCYFHYKTNLFKVITTYFWQVTGQLFDVKFLSCLLDTKISMLMPSVRTTFEEVPPNNIQKPYHYCPFSFFHSLPPPPPRGCQNVGGVGRTQRVGIWVKKN
jgi:hypothetical protein